MLDLAPLRRLPRRFPAQRIIVRIDPLAHWQLPHLSLSPANRPVEKPDSLRVVGIRRGRQALAKFSRDFLKKGLVRAL